MLRYDRGVELIGGNRSGPLLHLVPLFAAVLAVVFLGKQPGLHHAIGASRVVGGVFIAGRNPGRVRNQVAAPAERA